MSRSTREVWRDDHERDERARSLARVERAVERVESAERELRSALRVAHEGGASLRELASAARTSHTRVQRLIAAADKETATP